MTQLMMRRYETEDDYWRIRAFLREVFLLNDRRERSWQVTRLDYWRWHGVENCEPYDWEHNGTFLWETASGQIAAVLNPEGQGEAFFQIHPDYHTPDLECEMLQAAERYLAVQREGGQRWLRVWAYSDDPIRQALFAHQGYRKGHWAYCERQRSLDLPIPEVPVVEGYTIRSLGGFEELPARSWASWRGFHPDEPDEKYEGWEWYRSIQRMPMYRRDLDIVAAAPDGTIASLCTVWLDDVTRTGCFEPVATVPEHLRRGLAKAVMTEGMRRVKRLGATLVTVAGASEAANALYSSVMGDDYMRAEPWEKVW